MEVQNEEEKTMWKGRIGNDKQGLDTLAEKLSVIERSNNQKIVGVYINPTGNYHVPLQHFLQSKGYRVVAVNPIISANARKMDNLGRTKNDSADAATLASIPWKKKGMQGARSHERDELSELTRMHEAVDRNITRIVNSIWSDIAAVFP
ncbi:transposase [mine drainage metagenome]|uniref:Transposase n=1 Tax=mine drainage metagenome TaxID=410659 RepID=T1AMC1_9ZZZZ